jgi:uncharacterized lipoprotein YddW (UPF0748 family)
LRVRIGIWYFEKMTTKSLIKQADVKRILRAAKQAGLNPTSVRIAPDGTVEFCLNEETLQYASNDNPWDKAVG